MRKTGGRPVNWQQLHPAEAAENLQSSERGLASEEALALMSNTTPTN